jgi:hypothetical protein
MRLLTNRQSIASGATLADAGLFAPPLALDRFATIPSLSGNCHLVRHAPFSTSESVRSCGGDSLYLAKVREDLRARDAPVSKYNVGEDAWSHTDDSSDSALVTPTNIVVATVFLSTAASTSQLVQAACI